MVTGVEGPCVGNIAPISRLDFPGLCLQDGPLAIRQATNASVFPAGVAAAATWDNGLMNAGAVALGAEFRDKGAHIYLGYVSSSSLRVVNYATDLTRKGRWQVQ